MYLTKDQILKANDLKMEEVNVSEWGGIVIVRSLTGFERDEFEKESLASREANDGKVNLSNFRARLVSITVCDPDGNLLFNADDIVISQLCFFPEGFEVYVDRVKPGLCEIYGFGTLVAVADKDVCKALGFC